MKKFFPAFIFLSAIVLLPSYRLKPLHTSEERSGLARSSNQFTFAFFHNLLKDDVSNRLVSPVGVYLGLNLLYNAAAKETRDSIGQTLRVIDMDIRDLNVQSRTLMEQFSLSDKKAHFSMANAIWCNRKKLRLTSSFDELSQRYYYSTVQSLPFNGKSTAEKINDWITQKSDDHACTVMQSAHPDDMVYMTNACNFYAGWQHPFDVSATQEDFFNLRSGHRVVASFMHKVFVARTYSDTSFSMLELPYGNGDAYSLFIVLPDNFRQSLRDFTASFQGEELFDAMKRMNTQWVDLSLPRWEQSMDASDMMPALGQMGMRILNDRGGYSDLSNMCTKPISGVKNTMDLLMGKYDADPVRVNTPVAGFYHTACLNVNENGSMMDITPQADSIVGTGQHRGLPFKADRPFLYFVVAKQQQVVLLAGVMNNPGAAVTTTMLHGSSPSRPGGLRLPRGKQHQKG